MRGPSVSPPSAAIQRITVGEATPRFRNPQSLKGDASVLPIGLTDDQLATIQRHAEPLYPQDRDLYLRRVAELLNGRELGDGAVSRAARTAQREYLRPPDLSVSKYR
jgi:hypothetical protein